MCHITFRLHVYELPIRRWRGRCCWRPLQPTNEPAHLSDRWDTLLLYLWHLKQISSHVYGNKTSYFKEKHDLFLNITNCFFLPKPNQSLSAQRCHNIKLFWRLGWYLCAFILKAELPNFWSYSCRLWLCFCLSLKI